MATIKRQTAQVIRPVQGNSSSVVRQQRPTPTVPQPAKPQNETVKPQTESAKNENTKPTKTLSEKLSSNSNKNRVKINSTRSNNIMKQYPKAGIEAISEQMLTLAKEKGFDFGSKTNMKAFIQTVVEPTLNSMMEEKDIHFADAYFKVRPVKARVFSPPKGEFEVLIPAHSKISYSKIVGGNIKIPGKREGDMFYPAIFDEEKNFLGYEEDGMSISDELQLEVDSFEDMTPPNPKDVSPIYVPEEKELDESSVDESQTEEEEYTQEELDALEDHKDIDNEITEQEETDNEEDEDGDDDKEDISDDLSFLDEL